MIIESTIKFFSRISFYIAFFSLVIGLASLVIAFILHRKTKSNAERTQELVKNISAFFRASSNLGIVTAFPDRGTALKDEAESKYRSDFINQLKDDEKLIIIGSSLLGLRLNFEEQLDDIIAERVRNKKECKFMLTHPCYSVLREWIEEKKPGTIKEDVENTIKNLKELRVNCQKSVRFYRGAPTCFALITSDAMLINPYCYQTEAYRCFCIKVQRKPHYYQKTKVNINEKINIPPNVIDQYKKEFDELMEDPEERRYCNHKKVPEDIYGQFYKFHYLLPWFSKEAVSLNEYENICRNCPQLAQGTIRMHCVVDEKRVCCANKTQVSQNQIYV